MLRRQLIEVLQPPVIGIHNFAGDVARSGGTVEWHHHAWIILTRITVDVLRRRSAHEQMSARIVCLNANSFGLVHQDAVGYDLGIEPRSAKFLRDVFSGLVILRSCRHVRLSSQSFEVLTCQVGIRHGQKLLFDLGLCGEISVAENRLRSSLR